MDYHKITKSKEDDSYTEERQKKCFEAVQKICPKCFSHNTDPGSIEESSNTQGMRWCSCQDCDEEWYEIYTVSNLIRVPPEELTNTED